MEGIIAGLAAGGATAATTAAQLLSAGSGIASGIAGFSQARGAKKQADINAYIGRTRALQTDVAARQGMESEFGTMRSVFAANQQRPNVSTMEVFNELRSVRDRERRIEFGNRMAEAADWKMRARNEGAGGTGALLGGFIKAGPSSFDLYQLKTRGKT